MAKLQEISGQVNPAPAIHDADGVLTKEQNLQCFACRVQCLQLDSFSKHCSWSNKAYGTFDSKLFS